MVQTVKTILVVVIVTCLVWVFAERAVTQEAEVEVMLELPTQPESILVQFLDEEGNPMAETRMGVTLTVRGSGRRILTVNENYINTKTVDISKIAMDLKEAGSKDSWENVTALFDNRLSSNDGENTLQITSSEPASVHLRVTQLVQQSLPVKVFDPEGIELVPESIVPSKVDAFVMEGTPAEVKVTLSEVEQRQAFQGEIEVMARVTAPNRMTPTAVKLKLQEGGKLKSETIRNARLEISKPATMEGKYIVVLDDPSQLDEPIECRGTPQAVEQYSKSDYHLILKVNEEDQNKESQQIVRPLDYNLPKGYGQIEIVNKKQVPIKFHLEKVTKPVEVPGRV